MMLTTKSRYAIMAVLELASKNGDKPCSLAEISNQQSISINYLEQIFLMLKRAGIVRSVKGPGGGYFINSNNIKISSIIDAVYENTKMTRCSSKNNKVGCIAKNLRCNSHYLWDGLTSHIRSYFDAISIADVIKKGCDLTTKITS